MGKTRTITLTGRAPVRIDENDWPVIARASGDTCGITDPVLREQALQRGEADEYALRVRQHSDGRTIVYGTYTVGLNRQHDGLTHAGYVLMPGFLEDPSAEALSRVIGKVGKELGVPAQLIADCIADLPAEEI